MNPHIIPSGSRPVENHHDLLWAAVILLLLITASLAFWSYPLLTILSIITIWVIVVLSKNLAKAWEIHVRHAKQAKRRQKSHVVHKN